MSQRSAVAIPETVPEKTTPLREKQESRPRRQPPYAVIVHNDDANSMEFVVALFRKVLKYSYVRCVKLMLTVHFKGRAAVWSGSREVAELKRDQLRSAGVDPDAIARGGARLQITVEPLPQ